VKLRLNIIIILWPSTHILFPFLSMRSLEEFSQQ
jgi:hypothetical protein